MEIATLFHPGRAPEIKRLTAYERMKKRKQKQQTKQKGKTYIPMKSAKRLKISNSKEKPLFSSSSFSFSFSTKQFSILPLSHFRFPVAMMLPFVTASLPQQLDLLKNLESLEKTPFDFLSPTLRQDLAKAIFDIQAARWKFRKVLHFWRFKHLKCVSNEDLLTGEVPKNPVTIVDWSHKRCWKLEASTINKDIHQRLLFHDGVFDSLQHPRNPYTNLPLTLSQMISIWNQLDSFPSTKKGPTNWVFTAFSNAGFRIKSVKEEFERPLRLLALRTTMQDLTHEDTFDKLMDFIESAFEYEGIPCPNKAFEHVLKHHPSNSLLLEWHRLCLNYNEASILYNASPHYLDEYHDKIWDFTKTLVYRQREIFDLYSKDIDKEIHALLALAEEAMGN